MTEQRHPNIEQIIWVLKHLTSIWNKETPIKYCYNKYMDLKRKQEQGK